MNKDIFESGLKELNLDINENQLSQFNTYSSLLKEWNEKMNLTAIVDDDGIAVKHFLDSVLPLKYINIKQGASVADIGTGAGFPGLPIKILRPDINITLIDSLNKRINFLKTVADSCNLENILCIHGRAEELGKANEYREKYDVIVSRAVANMRVLCEYCLPFVKVGGIFVALKASDIDEELSQAKPIIGTLGGKVEDIIDAPLPQSPITRKLVVIRKDKETPKQFPRKSNKIK